MSNFVINPHPAQLSVWQSGKRFTFLRAGRRFGKTQLAVEKLCAAAFMATRGVGYYVAPTFKQAKDIAWLTFKEVLHGHGCSFIENTGEIKFPHGVLVRLKGADDPDSLRGVKLFCAVLDEIQDMKEIFDAILLPALMDLQGEAICIGTPKGFNNMYRMEQRALKDPESWAVFHFTTYDNPYIPKSEVDNLKKSMSSFFFEQEIMAQYKIADSALFKADWFNVAEKEPKFDGFWYSTVDMAGFNDFEKAVMTDDPASRLDETSQAIVKVYGDDLWYVKNVDAFRDTKGRTAARIVRNATEAGVITLGVEKGALYQAILPELRKEMQTQGGYSAIEPVSHNNQNKIIRILYALQGRMEHGKILFAPGAYLEKFKDQLLSIPNPTVKDDMPDSLSMIAQIAPEFVPNASDILLDRLGEDKIDTDW